MDKEIECGGSGSCTLDMGSCVQGDQTNFDVKSPYNYSMVLSLDY